MSTVEQLNSRISVVNAKSKQLNNERQVNIGKRETLTKQLNEALEQYEKQYGVKLTPETFEAEYARVAELRSQEVTRLETILGLIDAGRYDEVKRMVEGESTVVEEAEQSMQNVAKPTEVVGTVADIVNETAGQDVQPVAPPVTVTPITESITPNVGVQPSPLAAPIQSSPVVAPTPSPVVSPIPAVTPALSPVVTPAPAVAPSPAPSPVPAVAPSPAPAVAPSPAPAPIPVPIPMPSLNPVQPNQAMPNGFQAVGVAPAPAVAPSPAVAPAPAVAPSPAVAPTSSPNKDITSFGVILGGAPLQP